jgi:pimeloyl-ACP methyl ester carboxylesterase
MLNDDPVRIPEPPAIEGLGTLSMPTLVIVGERDLLDFRCAADIMEERITGAKKVVMPSVGHMSNMEDSERFNEIVLGFLAELA